MILICFFNFGFLSDFFSVVTAVFFLPVWPVSLSFLVDDLPVDFLAVPEVRFPRAVLFLAGVEEDFAAEALAAEAFFAVSDLLAVLVLFFVVRDVPVLRVDAEVRLDPDVRVDAVAAVAPDFLAVVEPVLFLVVAVLRGDVLRLLVVVPVLAVVDLGFADVAFFVPAFLAGVAFAVVDFAEDDFVVVDFFRVDVLGVAAFAVVLAVVFFAVVVFDRDVVFFAGLLDAAADLPVAADVRFRVVDPPVDVDFRLAGFLTAFSSAENSAFCCLSFSRSLINPSSVVTVSSIPSADGALSITSLSTERSVAYMAA